MVTIIHRDVIPQPQLMSEERMIISGVLATNLWGKNKVPRPEHLNLRMQPLTEVLLYSVSQYDQYSEGQTVSVNSGSRSASHV